MNIPLRHADDLNELDRRIGQERHAMQRDRLRAVRLALEGCPEPVIRAMLGRSRDFVQNWCYAYRPRKRRAGGDPAQAPTGSGAQAAA